MTPFLDADGAINSGPQDADTPVPARQAGQPYTTIGIETPAIGIALPGAALPRPTVPYAFLVTLYRLVYDEAASVPAVEVMSACPNLEVAWLSDPGLKRSHNEDHAASDPSLGLVVIADGMGGYRSGEVASALAVHTIVRHVRRFQHPEGPDSQPESAGQSAALGQPGAIRPAGEMGLSPASRVLIEAIGSANTAVFQTGRREAECEGMATTIIAALFNGDRIAVGHVGDSRLYRWRGSSIEQITTDHSLVQELIEQGVCTPEEAAQSSRRNLVTRAIGIHETVEVDVCEDEVLPDDVFLLCTDGLHDLVSNQEMYLTLRQYSANLSKAAARLVAMAKERGGHDNISVMLARPRVQRRLRWAGRLRRWLG